MSFWDLFVFRVCIGLGEGVPIGFTNCIPTLEFAYQRRLLKVGPELNDLSILLLWSTSASQSPLYQASMAEWERRMLIRFGTLTSIDVRIYTWSLLRETLVPRLADWNLHYYFFADARQRLLLEGTVYTLFFPSLIRFLERLTFGESHVLEALSAPYFTYRPIILQRLDYSQMVDEMFQIELYREIGRAGWPVARALPERPPDWFNQISGAERLFLRCAFRSLSEEQRLTLYLSLYANLNVDQIGEVRGLSPKAVLDSLRTTWRQILECLARAISA